LAVKLGAEGASFFSRWQTSPFSSSPQATMDLIQWFIPLLKRLPRDHRFALGHRLVHGLYDLLEGLVAARYATAKLERLEPLNARLDLLRLQIRLLHKFQPIDARRERGWIGQQRRLGHA